MDQNEVIFQRQLFDCTLYMIVSIPRTTVHLIVFHMFLNLVPQSTIFHSILTIEFTIKSLLLCSFQHKPTRSYGVDTFQS